MPDTLHQVFEDHGLSVTAEALDKLKIYEALLNKWQKAINLVSNTTLNEAAKRHFFDSAQLLRHIPDLNVTLADLGSGAGFPGMVLAILGVRNVHLLESDTRKATFLQTVSRETNSPVTVHARRIEDCQIAQVGLVTARALAPLTDLLDHMARLAASKNTYGLFLKGARWQEELEAARKKWDFTAEIFPSETDPAGKIIRIGNLIAKRCGT